MKKQVLHSAFLLLITFQSISQTFYSQNTGISLGLLLNFGTHINSIGVNLNSYYAPTCFQLNLGSSVTFNLTSYGKRRNFVESRTNLGLILLGGKRQIIPDYQLNGLFHNTRYNYGIGFNYIAYFDNAGTSQLSGGWSVHLKNTALFFENDVFGGQSRDRFRTGHFLVSYRYEKWRYGLGFYIWTGETKGSEWQKTPLKNCPSGFRILEELPYGKTSHGILYGSVNYNLGYGQVAFGRLGIDSERLRDAFQNRLIHDLIFLPEKVERHTPHYPTLDENGCATFDKKLIRKDRFYFQAGLNENWSN